MPKSLSAEVALEHRLAEVAERGEDRDHEAEQQAVAERVPRRDAEDRDDDRADARSTRPCPPSRPSTVLFGDTSGIERSAADARADEVADDVVADRAEREPDDHPDAVGVHEQQPGEPAEHADVGEAEAA